METSFTLRQLSWRILDWLVEHIKPFSRRTWKIWFGRLSSISSHYRDQVMKKVFFVSTTNVLLEWTRPQLFKFVIILALSFWLYFVPLIKQTKYGKTNFKVFNMAKLKLDHSTLIPIKGYWDLDLSKERNLLQFALVSAGHIIDYIYNKYLYHTIFFSIPCRLLDFI